MPILQEMRDDLRAITGTDITQMPDSSADLEINNYYLYKFPQELSTLRLQQWYEFNTIPNQDTYTLSQDYIVIEPPFYCSGWPMGFYEDPTQFYSYFNQVKARANLGEGDGGTSYNYSLAYKPIVKGTVMISSGVESMNDNSLGALSSPQGGVGTIDYLTGALSVNFFNAVVVGQKITGEWETYVASQPTAVLFFNQQLVLRPVPDIAYGIKALVTVRPTALLAANDEPRYKEWSDMVVIGAALEVFKKRGDLDQYNRYRPLFDEERTIAERRTAMQLANQRAPSRYAPTQNMIWPYNLYPYS